MKTTSGYAEINGGKLYYEMAGEGAAVVLSHAAFVDSGMWDAQFSEFAQHFRTIRYDMRGFGKSDVATGPVSRRDDLYRLLQHLGIERAALVGCSASGEAALDLALEYPELVTALVIVAGVPGGFQMQGEPPRYVMDMIGALQNGELERGSELQIRIWFDGQFREPDQVEQGLRARAAAMNRIAVRNNTFFIADAQPLNPLEPPALARLADVHAPTLIIAGALDSPEIIRAADVMAAGIAGAQQLIIPGTAHLPNMEQPTVFNQAVLAFLRGKVT